MTGTAHWLAAGVETLAERLHAQRHRDADCDVLIVGSGYGGAVAAARLAGRHVVLPDGSTREAVVWVVERGREYLPGMYASRFAELPGQVRFSRQDGAPPRGYAEALYDVRLGDDCHVLLGSGLGGGSLINAGVMERPDDAVWAAGWPTALDRQALDDGFARALQMLAPQSAPATAKFTTLQMLAEHRNDSAQPCQLAVHFGAPADNAAGVTMQRCTLCGDCLTGCNQGAKGTLDTNYLAFAAARRAQFFCGVTVEKLLAPLAKTAPWRVVSHSTDPGLRPPGATAMTIRALHVVLAAGALGSTEILLRSQSDRLAFSPRLGRHFSANGDLLAGVFRHANKVNAAADQESDPADDDARQVGPTISGLVRHQAGAHPFVIEEFAVPGALSRVFGEVMATFGLFPDEEAEPAPTTEDAFAANGHAITHSGLYGAMGDDGAQGIVRLAEPPGGAERAIDAGVRIDWPDLKSHPLFDAQMQWLRSACLGPAGGDVVANPIWRLIANERLKDLVAIEPGPAVTVHPLGGCAMGNSLADGVVDQFGRVFAADGSLHDGLAVLDGAVVPKALGINPALTIAALAEQAVVSLRDEWGLRCPETMAVDVLAPRPRWSRERGPAARKPTAVRMRETLQGRITLAGTSYWATLALATSEIADLGALLLARDRAGKTVPIEHGLLTLYPAAADDDEFSRPLPADLPQPVARATLAGQVQLFVLPDDETDNWRELRYALTVQAVEQGDVLQPDQALFGRKKFAHGSGSPWRQLTELGLWAADNPGGNSVGTLCLDLDALARDRHPLLTVQRQSSAPDALADLAAFGLFLLRIFLAHQAHGLYAGGDYDAPRIAANLEQRLPGALDGQAPQVLPLGPHGARLSRYRPSSAAAGRPALLIHGFGAAGSTFAHPSVGVNLVQALLRAGREAWVLDLRTSIGNEPADPAQPRGGPWTFDEVAREDIPAALAMAAAQSGAPRIDVIAHCIGAAMFTVAALEVPAMQPQIGAVVLSQVAPLLRLSPMNRLRGYLASYLEAFLGSRELDVRADWKRERRPDGSVGWARDPTASGRLKVLDALLATFPYHADEMAGEEYRVERLGVDFRVARRRSDAIWGHLMEFDRVGDDVWKHLDAFNGWAKLRSLAQTIHYARHGLLTDEAGRNKVLRQESLVERFAFPVLVLHGRRNRVFHWQGSHEAYTLIAKLRGREVTAAAESDDYLHWGGDSDVQLWVAKRYGHQDCLLGRDAHRDLFPKLLDFLDRQAAIPAPAPAPATTLPIEFEAPWIGPMQGALRKVDARYVLRLLVHPHPRRARTIGVVLVPIDRASGTPLVPLARGIAPVQAALGLRLGQPDRRNADQTSAMLDEALELVLDARIVPARFDEFIVLVAHTDLPLAAAPLDADGLTTMTGAFEAGADPKRWLVHGAPLHPDAAQELNKQLARPPLQPALAEYARLKIDAAVCAAADGSTSAPLCFALASCQYPPGLLDEPAAGASFARLAADCAAPEGPRPQFLLTVGDQVYVDATAGVFDPGSSGRAGDVVRKAYELNWRLAPMRAVAARLPLYTMLDDHEVRDNWQQRAGGNDDAETRAALDAYARYQQTLNAPPLLPGLGRHYTFAPAGALVIVLDTRSQRDARRVGGLGGDIDLDAACIVPDEVIDAALQRLRAAPATCAKFVVSAAPLLPPERIRPARPASRLRSDSWAGYPRSAARLLAGIREHGIEHVVLLAGDAHASALCTLDLDQGPQVHAVMSSGLYAPWPFANARAESFVLDGPVTVGHGVSGVITTHAWSYRAGYALLCLSGDAAAPHRRLQATLRAADGGADVAHTLWGEPLI
jgi:cholesterol oxidase